MDNISIAIAKASQQPSITAILEENRAWLKSKGIQQWVLPFTSEWVDQRIERREFYIASIAEQAVGVFRLIESDPTIWENASTDAFYIHSLAVSKKWKGKAIGRSMLKWAEEYAVKNGRKYIRLDCMAENPVLCAYYERAGFISCGLKEIQYKHILWKARLYQKEAE